MGGPHSQTTETLFQPVLLPFIKIRRLALNYFQCSRNWPDHFSDRLYFTCVKPIPHSNTTLAPCLDLAQLHRTLYHHLLIKTLHFFRKLLKFALPARHLHHDLGQTPSLQGEKMLLSKLRTPIKTPIFVPRVVVIQIHCVNQVNWDPVPLEMTRDTSNLPGMLHRPAAPCSNTILLRTGTTHHISASWWGLVLY